MTQESYTTSSDMNETELLRSNRRVLDGLLIDQTTGKNIRWGTDSYQKEGRDFREANEIKINLITGWNDGLIKPRASKDSVIQLERTRNKAEVFTPSWVIKMQVDAVLKEFNQFPLEDFLKTKWLEITCGEAPYMVNRYDTVTGKINSLQERAGFIDAKFKRLNKEVIDHNLWVSYAIIIFQSSYGYEYQGDSLLLARENLLLTFMDNYFFMFGAVPSDELVLEIVDIVSKNVFQMDGLTYEVPYSIGKGESVQLSLFEEIEEDDDEPLLARIKLWDLEKITNFINIVKGGNREMKFDVVIGNPPYQDNAIGDNKTYNPPIYHLFLDSAYQVSGKVVMIHPARFLFNAGSTPKAWNKKMLNDPHLKVLYYDAKSQDVFPNTDIKGGIAVTYRDESKKFNPIKVFTAFPELSNILEKVTSTEPESLANIVYISESYKLTEKLHEDYPEAESKLSKGHKYDVRTNIFEKLPEVFTSFKPKDSKEYVQVYGRINNNREFRWIKREYLSGPDNFKLYKVFLPKSNGSGALGEVLSTPIIGQPIIGHTQTFISIGNFKIIGEAESCMKYIKSKFARVMVGILKVTQDNPPRVWEYVPLQDFTSNSDIDWSKSISEIDQQLYEKYGLTDEEINFIETNVKEMV